MAFVTLVLTFTVAMCILAAIIWVWENHTYKQNMKTFGATPGLSNLDVKQVIIWRTDLKVRTGKKMAQASHASMWWLMDRIQKHWNDETYIKLLFNDAEKVWLNNGKCAKIVLQVNTEAELIALQKQAEDAGLNSFLVRDAGKTEFNGVETITALAIGPNKSSKIDLITSKLRLY